MLMLLALMLILSGCAVESVVEPETVAPVEVVEIIEVVEQEPTVTLTELDENRFKGWVAVVTGGDIKVTCQPETTLEAANRTGALLAINGGGFWSTTKPLGNTVIDGELVTGFTQGIWDKHSPNFFIGIDYDNNLVGGQFKTELELWSLKPEYGVTWGPQLVKDGEPLYYGTEDYHPRTAIGQTADGDYIFIVIDGRSSVSRGASFRQLTDLMIRQGAVIAFNLDGGGSGTLIYNGEVLNNPSDGSPRTVATNILVVR